MDEPWSLKAVRTATSSSKTSGNINGFNLYFMDIVSGQRDRADRVSHKPSWMSILTRVNAEVFMIQSQIRVIVRISFL